MTSIFHNFHLTLLLEHGNMWTFRYLRLVLLFCLIANQGLEMSHWALMQYFASSWHVSSSLSTLRSYMVTGLHLACPYGPGPGPRRKNQGSACQENREVSGALCSWRWLHHQSWSKWCSDTPDWNEPVITNHSLCVPIYIIPVPNDPTVFTGWGLG